MTREELPSKRDPEALDDNTTSPSKSSGSSAVLNHDRVSQSAGSASVQPADIKQVIFFLTFTLKETIQQTVYTAQQSLRCTWWLVRELPRPCVDSVRILVPLWLTVFHAISLVILALAQRVASDGLDRAQRFLAKLAKQRKR